MNSSSQCSSGASSSGANVVWLISFGDLLTLLVCFFLVLTPWTKVKFGSTASNQSVTAATQREHISGTALANRSLGPRTSLEQVGEFVLSRNAFGRDQEAQLREVIESVRRTVAEGHVGARRVIVELCGSQSRVDVLRRVGSGLAEALRDRLELEVIIDGKCGAIQAQHPRFENPVGVIRILQK
jgi:hypothetical protein